MPFLEKYLLGLRASAETPFLQDVSHGACGYGQGHLSRTCGLLAVFWARAADAGQICEGTCRDRCPLSHYVQ
jgi:hypothetical protein